MQIICVRIIAAALWACLIERTRTLPLIADIQAALFVVCFNEGIAGKAMGHCHVSDLQVIEPL